MEVRTVAFLEVTEERTFAGRKWPACLVIQDEQGDEMAAISLEELAKALAPFLKNKKGK